MIQQVPIQQVQADNTLSTILKGLGGGVQQGYAARAAQAPQVAPTPQLPPMTDAALGIQPPAPQGGIPGFDQILQSLQPGPAPVDPLAGITGQSPPSNMLLQRYGMSPPMMV